MTKMGKKIYLLPKKYSDLSIELTKKIEKDEKKKWRNIFYAPNNCY